MFLAATMKSQKRSKSEALGSNYTSKTNWQSTIQFA